MAIGFIFAQEHSPMLTTAKAREEGVTLNSVVIYAPAVDLRSLGKGIRP